MINDIDRDTFLKNLSLTQAYCHLQKDNKEKDNATVFRTFNPVFRNEPIFSFEIQYMGYGKEGGPTSFNTTNWSVDPYGETDGLIEWLFNSQLIFKECQKDLNPQLVYDGKILVTQIDDTVIDGASEVVSDGLIDVYDLPPVDTWIYLASSKERRLLFAWIPAEFHFYANDAVLVNCVGCLQWFKEGYPELFQQIIPTTS